MSASTSTRSKRLSSGEAIAVLTLTSAAGSYFPLGLVAATTVARAFNLHTSLWAWGMGKRDSEQFVLGGTTRVHARASEHSR